MGFATWSYATNPAICTSETCCNGGCVGMCPWGSGTNTPTCAAKSHPYSRFCPCRTQAARGLFDANIQVPRAVLGVAGVALAVSLVLGVVFPILGRGQVADQTQRVI